MAKDWKSKIWDMPDGEVGNDARLRSLMAAPSVHGVPAPIPPTTPLRYVSFMAALNLREGSEVTGGWHFEGMFYTDPVDPKPVTLAGQGGAVDTTVSLRSRGVREMGDVLRAHGLIENERQVWVADHFRAIADMAYRALLSQSGVPLEKLLSNSEINAWLNTPEELATLRHDYLLPLRGQMSGEDLRRYDRWLDGIGYAE